MKKRFLYLAFTTDRIFSITSNSQIDAENENQLKWLARECGGIKPTAILPITKENAACDLFDAMKTSMIWL